MGLVKAEIKNLDTNESLQVKFNPKEYTFEKTAPWKEHQIQGLDAPAYEWTSGAPMQLSVELFFDVYEEKTADARDVRTFTDKIENMAHVNPDKHRPPILLFCWGKKLQFRCLLKQLTPAFTMFLDDGTPVRAVLQCLFTEFTPPEEQLKGSRATPRTTRSAVS